MGIIYKKRKHQIEYSARKEEEFFACLRRRLEREKSANIEELSNGLFFTVEIPRFSSHDSRLLPLTSGAISIEKSANNTFVCCEVNYRGFFFTVFLFFVFVLVFGLVMGMPFVSFAIAILIVPCVICLVISIFNTYLNSMIVECCSCFVSATEKRTLEPEKGRSSAYR